MKRKFKKNYLVSDQINFKNHWAIDTEYPIIGSKGDKYTVRFTEKGLTCDCIGMTMHGKCKHSTGVLEKWI